MVLLILHTKTDLQWNLSRLKADICILQCVIVELQGF